MPESLSVVIPVYNSEKTLEEIFNRLSRVLPRLCPYYELIFVDDGSKDKSFDKLKELHQKDQRVKGIQLTQNFGQQHALMCGLNYTQGDLVITMDDDLQHPPEEIGKLVTKIRMGYDVVYGIPKFKNHHKHRNASSELVNLVFSLLFFKPLGIRIGSFRILKKSIVKRIILEKRPFVYVSALTFQHTRNVANVLVNHEGRKYGSSNYNLIKLMAVFLNIIICFSYQFFHFSIFKKSQYEIRENCF
ncbi:MAG: glycosyltransferase family 2 protein [Dehalobacterium sp.]